MVQCGLDWPDAGQGKAVGAHMPGIHPSSSITCKKVHDYLSNWQLISKNSAP
jgi:hypothetical protein